MNNILAYYYDLHPDILNEVNDNYFFEYYNNIYCFLLAKTPINDIRNIYDITEELKKRNIIMHDIILNNENKAFTIVDGKPYILMQINVNKEAPINLPEICYINNNSISIEADKSLYRNNWTLLWETKNDHFESQISEVEKKYPNIFNYANYYIGMAENAIVYVKNAQELNDDALLSIGHRRIDFNGTYFNLYNPLEIIYDYRIRDVCEYIKSAFFNNYDAYKLISEYFSNNYLTYKEALLFYGRLLYPSYFFDMEEKIINDGLSEDLILNIVNKSADYEMFLRDVYYYLSKLYNKYIPSIDWIIKRSF